ncbi:hypothetical protein PBI_PAEDORE_61 [Streptomyces phage Paedore]|uniref:Uncharacterized protein n=1 Tax=Streptomyces phage Paedore TaxID=2108134 RepID=A0A2P1JTV9_9CAUD|nr:hypothetical protein KGG91_gp61 [Streptomyces phage Paedore]AVO22544.1 hypothetical protein PBI_PAEDORE_61 [Streptomyces phage Paedore]
MKYLKVEIEGKFVGSDVTLYARLDGDEEYTDADLDEIAQNLVNEEFPWGQSVVDERDVPEGERP